MCAVGRTTRKKTAKTKAPTKRKRRKAPAKATGRTRKTEALKDATHVSITAKATPAELENIKNELGGTVEREEKPAPAKPRGRPKKLTHAVIIPAFNSAWCLAECLGRVEDQTQKPDVVMVGVDACEDTLTEAIRCRDEMKGRLDIRAYMFPRHVGPYRIRNTLAMLAPVDVLHFFDADDLMYERHCEMMSKCLKRGLFMTATAELVEQGADKAWSAPRPWDRAKGVVSILRIEFIQHGGFEPWVCAADTETHVRWQRGGLKAGRPKLPTFLVRKHADSLTISEGTGYRSELRRGYRDEIARRMKGEPERSGAIGIADVYEVTTAGPAEAHTVELQLVRFGMPQEPQPIPQAAEGHIAALNMVERLLAMNPPGFDATKRKNDKMVRAWLAEQREHSWPACLGRWI